MPEPLPVTGNYMKVEFSLGAVVKILIKLTTVLELLVITLKILILAKIIGLSEILGEKTGEKKDI